MANSTDQAARADYYITTIDQQFKDLLSNTSILVNSPLQACMPSNLNWLGQCIYAKDTSHWLHASDGNPVANPPSWNNLISAAFNRTIEPTIETHFIASFSQAMIGDDCLRGEKVIDQPVLDQLTSYATAIRRLPAFQSHFSDYVDYVCTGPRLEIAITEFDTIRDCTATGRYWADYVIKNRTDPIQLRDTIRRLAIESVASVHDSTLDVCLQNTNLTHLYEYFLNGAPYCRDAACKSLRYKGNPDIAGLGAQIVYGAIAAVTLIIATIGVFHEMGLGTRAISATWRWTRHRLWEESANGVRTTGTSNTLRARAWFRKAQRSSQISSDDSEDSTGKGILDLVKDAGYYYADALIYFALMANIAANVWIYHANTIYELVMAQSVSLLLGNANVVMIVFSFQYQIERDAGFRLFSQFLSLIMTCCSVVQFPITWYTPTVNQLLPYSMQDTELEDMPCYAGDTEVVDAMRWLAKAQIVTCFAFVVAFCILFRVFWIWFQDDAESQSALEFGSARIVHATTHNESRPSKLREWIRKLARFLIVTITLVGAGSMAALYWVAILHIFKRSAERFGNSFGDTAFGFGQILAISFFVQITAYFLYCLFQKVGVFKGLRKLFRNILKAIYCFGRDQVKYCYRLVKDRLFPWLRHVSHAPRRARTWSLPVYPSARHQQPQSNGNNPADTQPNPTSNQLQMPAQMDARSIGSDGSRRSSLAPLLARDGRWPTWQHVYGSAGRV